MGVIYKLKPKLKEYIVKLISEKPQLGCRRISVLVEKKFKFKVSKSAVHSVIKSAGIKMPVGRRRKARRGKIEAQGLGAIFLKAADYLLGGKYLIGDSVIEKLSMGEGALAKTEALLYSPLFFDIKNKVNLSSNLGLWSLISRNFTYDELLTYLNELEQVKPFYTDTLRIISRVLREVHCIKVILSDGSSFFLDGQMHTVWSTSYLPHDFATTLYNVKCYIDKYFRQNQPLILFMAPGYDIPTKEFFDFMSCMGLADPQISKIILYGNQFEEVETIPLEGAQKRYFIFGLWPWQFVEYRKVQLLGDFQPFYLETLKQQVYLANVEIELLQAKANKGVMLRGYALKLRPNDKISLVVLSNYERDQIKPQDLLQAYFSQWPNLQEGFQDFSRKVELFTYTATSRRFFSTENLKFDPKDTHAAFALLNYYLQALDLYARWHFFPSGYEEKAFEIAEQRFYNLKGHIRKQKDLMIWTFKPPSDYPYIKDLEYACRRVNERGIMLSTGLRLLCAIG
jgi:hypothetical protein